jgi:hypothetical protein
MESDPQTRRSVVVGREESRSGQTEKENGGVMNEWKLINYYHYYLVQGGHDGDVTGYLYSETPQQRANAAFIVRACNAHEDLLTACKNLLTVIVNEDVPQKVLDEAGILHAAIRKAEEE